MDSTPRGPVVVVGSLNRDVVLQVDRIPAPGETVLASESSTHRGGKGANQAVAAARLGADVSLIGKVGADTEGTTYLRALVSEGIDVEGVLTDIDRPTGTSTIVLADDAENAIVVVPGANGALRPVDVALSAPRLDDAAVTLAQLEVPLAAVEEAARLSGGYFVLNAAPASQVPVATLARTDVLVANRSEIALMAGHSPGTDPEESAASLRRSCQVGVVVVTLGAEGALLVDGSGTTKVTVPRVEAIDTTGAGDAFCGALAAAIAEGSTVEDAVRWAARVGATATMRLGAQSALPRRTEIVAS